MSPEAAAGVGTLADLPLLPRDDDGPVFAEPWQAQAFAVVVELTDRGLLTREEWAERLGAALAEAEARGETDTGERYYDHWLTTTASISCTAITTTIIPIVDSAPDPFERGDALP